MGGRGNLHLISIIVAKLCTFRSCRNWLREGEGGLLAGNAPHRGEFDLFTNNMLSELIEFLIRVLSASPCAPTRGEGEELGIAYLAGM